MRENQGSDNIFSLNVKRNRKLNGFVTSKRVVSPAVFPSVREPTVPRPQEQPAPSVREPAVSPQRQAFVPTVQSQAL